MHSHQVSCFTLCRSCPLFIILSSRCLTFPLIICCWFTVYQKAIIFSVLIYPCHLTAHLLIPKVFYFLLWILCTQSFLVANSDTFVLPRILSPVFFSHFTKTTTVFALAKTFRTEHLVASFNKNASNIGPSHAMREVDSLSFNKSGGYAGFYHVSLGLC